MMRLPRLRDLDPDLRRHHLPFYLRTEWIVFLAIFGVTTHFFWALVTIYERPANYSIYLRLSASIFAIAASFGYVFARLGSRFLGASWRKIRLGKEGIFDTTLGKATVGSGIALAALPQIVNAALASELLLPIPFYSGAVVGMSFSFFLWVSGIPR